MVDLLVGGPGDGVFENHWRLDQGPDQPGADLVDVYGEHCLGISARRS